MIIINIINFQLISCIVILIIVLGLIVIWVFINQIRRSIKSRDWESEREEISIYESVDVDIDMESEHAGEECERSKTQPDDAIMLET